MNIIKVKFPSGRTLEVKNSIWDQYGRERIVASLDITSFKTLDGGLFSYDEELLDCQKVLTHDNHHVKAGDKVFGINGNELIIDTISKDSKTIATNKPFEGYLFKHQRQYDCADGKFNIHNRLYTKSGQEIIIFSIEYSMLYGHGVVNDRYNAKDLYLAFNQAEKEFAEKLRIAFREYEKCKGLSSPWKENEVKKFIQKIVK